MSEVYNLMYPTASRVCVSARGLVGGGEYQRSGGGGVGRGAVGGRGGRAAAAAAVADGGPVNPAHQAPESTVGQPCGSLSAGNTR
eukprot:268141-Prorocentrum_minimum.AAC.1